MSSNPFFSTFPGEDTSGLGGIMVRFKQGRTVYSAKDVQKICDQYISTASSGTEVTIHMRQFLRNACLPFASTDALARLKALTPPTLRPTLDEHFNILLADEAPSRLQTEFQSQPQSLFFVGDVVDSSALQSLAPASERKPAVRISRSFSQTALAVLVRYEDGITWFPQQDIGTVCSYMKELNIRGADAWVSLVAFLRDAARPFATTSLRRELTSNDRHDVVQQYNLLVLDGAVKRLVEAARTRSNPNFHINSGGFQESMDMMVQDDGQLLEERECQMSEHFDHRLNEEMASGPFDARDGEADDEAEDESYDKENMNPAANRKIHSSERSLSARKLGDSPATFLVPLTGSTGIHGNALPSLTKKRHHERNTMLAPRRIRDMVRQYWEYNSRSPVDLSAEKEVFYVGGRKKHQIRPEYFWVLVQHLENDEPPITADQMTTVCPHWESLVGPSLAQRIKSANPDISEPLLPNETSQFPGRDVTLKEIANKLDALKDEVAAMTLINQDLREEIKELRKSSRSKARDGISPFPLSSSKKRRFDSDGGSDGEDTDFVDTPTTKFGNLKLHKLVD